MGQRVGREEFHYKSLVTKPLRMKHSPLHRSREADNTLIGHACNDRGAPPRSIGQELLANATKPHLAKVLGEALNLCSADSREQCCHGRKEIRLSHAVGRDYHVYGTERGIGELDVAEPLDLNALQQWATQMATSPSTLEVLKPAMEPDQQVITLVGMRPHIKA